MLIRRLSDGKLYSDITSAVEDFKCPGPCDGQCQLDPTGHAIDNKNLCLGQYPYPKNHSQEIAALIDCEILENAPYLITSLGMIMTVNDGTDIITVLQDKHGNNTVLSRVSTDIAPNGDTRLKLTASTESGSNVVHELRREKPSKRREAILNFIKFEDSTSQIWPWKLSANELRHSDALLYEIERLAPFDANDNVETDDLYDAIDKVAGSSMNTNM